MWTLTSSASYSKAKITHVLLLCSDPAKSQQRALINQGSYGIINQAHDSDHVAYIGNIVWISDPSARENSGWEKI